jgi:G:T-mismatch repair DNA endonuclease (very short patch repair protein)
MGLVSGLSWVDSKQFAEGGTVADRSKPDFVFPKLRLAVFVDGCFWHGCPRHSPPARWLCRSAMPKTVHPGAKTPRTGKRFWRDKLAAN